MASIIINNSKLKTKCAWSVGDCMEALPAVMASLFLSYSRFRASLIAFNCWQLVSLPWFGLYSHVVSTWAVCMLSQAKLKPDNTGCGIEALSHILVLISLRSCWFFCHVGIHTDICRICNHASIVWVPMTFNWCSFLSQTHKCKLMWKNNHDSIGINSRITDWLHWIVALVYFSLID